MPSNHDNSQSNQDKGEIFRVQDLYVRASATKRFINYVVDLLFFYLLLLGLGFVLAFIFPSFDQYLADDSIEMRLLDRVIGLVLYAFYMGAMEYYFSGQSIGKFVTKTRAVNWDGTKLTFLTTLKRGFSRAVPLAALSALGNPSTPWQDLWTGTLVINDLGKDAVYNESY